METKNEFHSRNLTMENHCFMIRSGAKTRPCMNAFQEACSQIEEREKLKYPGKEVWCERSGIVKTRTD